MATTEAAAAVGFAVQDSLSSEDLASTAMHVTLVEVREPIWIILTEVTN